MEKEFNPQDEFIDQLLLKNNISLRAVYRFADEHIKELEQAENIFDLKEERDKKLCIALFRLMAGKYADDISKNFCERYDISDSSIDDIFFEKNKLFLIAAFIYNPSFFAMSWNLCGIISSQIASRAETHVTVFQFQRKVHAFAASGADDIMKPIWSEDINQDGINGKLWIDANNKDNAGMVQFCFLFGEYRPEPPYFMRIHYTTNIDNIGHTAELINIAVNNDADKELIIASAPQNGIRYEKGLTITGREMLKNA